MTERRSEYGGRTQRGGAAGRRDLEAWASIARVLLTSNEFIYLN